MCCLVSAFSHPKGLSELIWINGGMLSGRVTPDMLEENLVLVALRP
jgi:hypothetical protein